MQTEHASDSQSSGYDEADHGDELASIDWLANVEVLSKGVVNEDSVHSDDNSSSSSYRAARLLNGDLPYFTQDSAPSGCSSSQASITCLNTGGAGSTVAKEKHQPAPTIDASLHTELRGERRGIESLETNRRKNTTNHENTQERQEKRLRMEVTKRRRLGAQEGKESLATNKSGAPVQDQHGLSTGLVPFLAHERAFAKAIDEFLDDLYRESVEGKIFEYYYSSTSIDSDQQARVIDDFLNDADRDILKSANQ